MSIPHAYAAVECNIDLLLSFRKQMKTAGVAVSVNDFVIRAVALALKECPLVNCLYVNNQVTSLYTGDIFDIFQEIERACIVRTFCKIFSNLSSSASLKVLLYEDTVFSSTQYTNVHRLFS